MAKDGKLDPTIGRDEGASLQFLEAKMCSLFCRDPSDNTECVNSFPVNPWTYLLTHHHSLISENEVQPSSKWVSAYEPSEVSTDNVSTAHWTPRRRKNSYPRGPCEPDCSQRGPRSEYRNDSTYCILPDERNRQSLQNKRVLSIDLSAIMAGSGIRGQFEEKFKALIRDIEAEASAI